jgi:hypothetical protein
MKILTKIWEILTFVFLGIIAGIVLFIKFLDKPEVVNEILIKKIKAKESDGNTIQVDVKQENPVEINKKKRIFNRNK